eukprot:6182010-Lingulodinium_polyedra.AAC.1
MHNIAQLGEWLHDPRSATLHCGGCLLCGCERLGCPGLGGGVSRGPPWWGGELAPWALLGAASRGHS